MSHVRSAILTVCLCAVSTLGTTLGAATKPSKPAAAKPAEQPAAPAQPKLVIPEPIFDFGERGVNSVLTHDFEIRNEGTADLVIQNVIPGCSCTAASADPVVKAGASSVIHAVLDTSGMGGALAKQIGVFTNDPAAPKTILTMQAIIKPHTTAKPDTLRIKGVQHEGPLSARVVLWAIDRDDLDIQSVESPYTYVKVAVREARGDENDPTGRGRQWVIDATLDPEAPIGALAGLVRVHTNHPTDSLVTVPVTGFQRPMLVITPPIAQLDDVIAGPSYLRILRLENFGEASVSVTSVASDVKGVSVEVQPQPDGKHIWLNVHLAAEMPKGPFRGTLVVSTTSPAVPRMEIPISGNVL